MSNYILFITCSVAGCSLAAVLLIYWRYRRMVRHYNNYIMKYIREDYKLSVDKISEK